MLTLLKGYSKHGVSPISISPASPLSPATFEYPIPSDLLRTLFSLYLSNPGELPSYHFDNRSLSIFSEVSPRPLRSVDSQTRLLRAALTRPHPPDAHDRKPPPRATTHDILPLVIVMWDRADEPAESEQCPGGRAMPSRGSGTSLRELLKEGKGVGEEKVRLFVKQRAENRRGGEAARKPCENPRFVSILVVHFLRNHAPTLIRRLNICADGVFVPRVGSFAGG